MNTSGSSKPLTSKHEQSGHSNTMVAPNRSFHQTRQVPTNERNRSQSSIWSKLRKLFRFVMIYGPGRTLLKVAGRLRISISLPTIRRPRPDIGFIGCGQFAFATIGYYLARALGRSIATCFDIDKAAEHSLQQAFAVANESQHKRWLRYRYGTGMPPLIRTFCYLFYRYILAGGFLDDKPAFAYHFLHALWYPMLIDLKYLELKKQHQGTSVIF